ncbi:M16 family metallopeptidase [Anaerobaca lacustris]|uniref:Pitrilysin family protein n=1 Tax=Anaerobaca lacustris TaxID=3044600 RepID=A0AAW6TSK8_9BACT|nr:pitrilysin family protein [Sedimentisphaerales bacterium M17dextr]
MGRVYRGRRRALGSAVLPLLAVLLATGPSGLAQDLAEFESRVTEFALDNGLRFIVLRRPEAPVVTCFTHANVGAVDEVTGLTGLAHLFEHMAFKGTRTIGTRDPEAEAEALAKIDEVFEAIRAERHKGGPADEQKLAELQSRLAEAQEQAQQYLVHDEFDEILKRAGGVGLNAGTSSDYTVYFVSLPANKLELWMLMESDRFLNPVLREFYSEKDVVMEERRLRTETQPVGKLLEEFLAAAYKAHPYGQPVIGHMSDIEAVTRAQAEAFFRTHYVPSNLTVAIVGDVDPDRVKTLAREYFGRIPHRPAPGPVVTVEPPQPGERRVVVEDPAQPFVLIGYHKPSIQHEDNAVFDAITDIMGSGRTSRLYRSLVKDKRIAMATSGFQGMPGQKYPGLFLFYAMPARGHTNQECERAIYDEIERLRNEPVSEQELQKAKTRARAALIRQLDSNSGLAEQLTFYEVMAGDWRNLFQQLERIDRVTAEDIQRVARTCFTTKNRTVGIIETTTGENES